MAVDLGDYIEEIKVQVNPPGTDLFPTALDDEWVTRLAGGFWDCRIQGITALKAFTADADGIITPQREGGEDISRELVQLVIVFTAFRAVVNAATALKTQFRGQAGPVSFEQQQSATVMRDVLTAIKEEKALILMRLGDEGIVTPHVIDAVQARDQATLSGFSSWMGSGFGWDQGPRFNR